MQPFIVLQSNYLLIAIHIRYYYYIVVSCLTVFPQNPDAFYFVVCHGGADSLATISFEIYFK